MNLQKLKMDKKLDELDEMIEEITVDSYNDDEKLWAFRQEIEDNVEFPADGFVIGEPVSIVEVDYDGNERRGLTAKCRREDGSEYIIAASDVMLPQASVGAHYIAAYRRWLNLDPYPIETKNPSRHRQQHRATDDDIDLSKPVELAVLTVKGQNARCRLLGSERTITLRASGLWEVAPGAIVTVEAGKQWSYAGHPYLSGKIISARIDVKALNLTPLALEDRGMWDPKEEYWGEEDQPVEEWAKPIISFGPRPMYEMEQVMPYENPDDPFSDPVNQSNDLKDAGRVAEARRILMELCLADLRCLDAHSHLGNLIFDNHPENAIQHYEVGLRIGGLSLKKGFIDVLPWGLTDNRPFLRCMHGYGLCLWRLGRFDEAERVFNELLWLNPSDNQGVRFIIDDVKSKTAWEDHRDEFNHITT